MPDERIDMPGEELETAPDPVAAADVVIDAEAPPRGYDFVLMVITLVLLAGLGVQSIIGTGYTWWAQRTDPGWMQTGYPGYVALMNTIAAPMILGLVIVLGLCVPKRLLSRMWLIGLSAALVVAGLAGWALTGSLTDGLALYLALASLLQLAVVVMTLADARGLTFLTRGRVVKVGSGMLHMGFILFALVVAALQSSPWMLPVFIASSLLIMVGAVLSFYAGRFARR